MSMQRFQTVTRRGDAGKSAVIAMAVIVLACAIVFLAVDRNVTPDESAKQEDPLIVDDESLQVPMDAVQPSVDDDPPVDELGEPRDIQASTYQLSPQMLEVVEMIGNGQFMEARAMLAIHLKRKSKSAPTEFLYGLSYQKEKRYELARPFFESSIDIDAGYRPAWYFYGWCLYYLGELERARLAFEQHLVMDPLEGDSHFGIGLIDLDENKLDDAEQRLRKAIELQQNNPRRVREVAKSHARLGDVYALRDELEKAKAELVIATEMWPDHYEAQFKLGRVLYRLGEDEAAEQAMRRFEEARLRIEGLVPVPVETNEPVEVEPDTQTEPSMDGGTPP